MTCVFTRRAFDIRKEGEITSQEFVLGLAAMDPNTPHGNFSAEMRYVPYEHVIFGL